MAGSLIAESAHAQSPVDGTWHSAFEVMGQSMLMDLEVNIADSSVLISNPEAAAAKKTKCSKVAWNGKDFSFEWPAAGLSFQSVYDAAGDSIYGTMSQSGIQWPVAFVREVREKIVPFRPQTPEAPFPYTTKDVSYFNAEDGTEIFATLTYPVNTSENYPVVILASGSGSQDRDCSILGHKTFLVIADQLARNGIASLRFDDRGAGKSKANYYTSSLTDFGNDVAAGIAFIQTQPELKGHKLGLIGHSEGGMHILLAEKQFRSQVGFLIFLCAPGLTGKQVLLQQQYEIPLKSGKSERVAAWNRSVFEGMSDIILKTKDRQKATDQIYAFLRKSYKEAPADAVNVSENQFVSANALFLNNDWGKEFLAFDPAVYLKKYKGPAAAFFGSEDLQVDAAANLPAFEQSLSKNPVFRRAVVEGLNHLMQICNTCTIAEYGELTETIAPVMLENIITTIKAFN